MAYTLTRVYEESVLIAALEEDDMQVGALVEDMLPGERRHLADACRLVYDAIARLETLPRYNPPSGVLKVSHSTTYDPVTGYPRTEKPRPKPGLSSAASRADPSA